MNRIIYKNPDNSVAVLIPAQKVLDAALNQSFATTDERFITVSIFR